MARLSISAVLLFAVVSAAQSQPFGRFGYTSSPDVPGFVLDAEGFVAKHARADRFRFVQKSRAWQPLETTEISQAIALSGGSRSPSKLRIELAAPGFSLHFPGGFGLRLASTASPYLSWGEGSVAGGVPTPALSWALVSFQDDQPPVLLAFTGAQPSLTIKGKAGDWRIESDRLDPVWVRVVLPNGTRGLATNSAASLGQAVRKAKQELPLWTTPAPRLVGLTVEGDQSGLTATWTFDRPGAVLPYPLDLAPLGGYPLKVRSRVRRVDAPTEQGRLAIAEEPTLVVRFPMRRIPTGRALSLGAPSNAIATVSPHDVPSVVEIALENLLASREPASKATAESASSTYIAEASYFEEPWTGQRLPYAADGTGIDLVAAQALLMQALATTTRATSEPNSLLTSLTWRRDWLSWALPAGDRRAARRAAALGAIAAALCPEPERRLQGAMFQAGLAAERGWNTVQSRAGLISQEPKLIEPLDSLRRGIFYMDPQQTGFDPLLRILTSELRLFGEAAASLEERENGIALAWHAGEREGHILTLGSGYPLEVAPGLNVEGLVAESALGFTVIRCRSIAPGACQVLLRIPPWAPTLPRAVAVPAYSEPVR